MDIRLELLYTIGAIFIFIGFLIAILSIFLFALYTKRVKGGGAVLIGPFPIVFAWDKESLRIVLILTLVIMIFAIILMILPYLLR